MPLSASKKWMAVGVVEISASNKDAIDTAVGLIKGIVAMPEVNEVYQGKIFLGHALRLLRRVPPR